MTTDSLQGLRVVADDSLHRHRGGTVLLGGSPLRVMRLTEAGGRTVDRLLAGDPVPSGAVATSLVLLLQQSQRTEEFLRRELTARLQNARCTWTRTFRPDCVPLLILAMLPSQRTPAVGTGAVTNILRDNRYSSPRPIPPSRSKPAFPSLSFASHTPPSRSE